MPHYRFKNINDAFETMVGLVHKADTGAAAREDIGLATYRTGSRNGPVIVVDEPVMITYENPKQRVLFNAVRDANPFFHVFESLWMLAGRNDIKPLTNIVEKYADFSDDGKTANGAYGYRWRNGWYYGRSWRDKPDGGGIDQLKIIAENLRNKPDCRRQVLSMWNVEDDLLKTGSSKDVCCNLNVKFLMVGTEVTKEQDPREWPDERPKTYRLDMTVDNRSNDLVWGLLGANVVHFSFLQEYMAARIGCEVGKYHHITNNMHAYVWNWKPAEWLAYYTPQTMHDPVVYDVMYDRKIETVPLVTPHVERFDREVSQFIDAPKEHYKEDFLQRVAGPMMYVHDLYKREKYGDIPSMLLNIEAEDWRTAAAMWVKRRLDKKGAKV